MSHNKNDTDMNSGSLPESEFILLVYAHLGRSLDAKGAAVLRQYLQDPYYVTCFVEICKQDRLIYEMFSAGLPLNITEPDSMDFVTWQKLAKYEKCAPAVEITQEKKIEEPIQEIQRQSVQIKINRGALITLVLSLAAVLLFVLIIRFVPSKSGIEVATLTDSIEAKWTDVNTSMNKGTRLVTGSTGYLLREGIAQIEFDNQAKVTIESPAEFEIVTGDQVKLNYGRLYAAIPQSAIGFTVQTQSARIIDLGTEFGIDAATGGDTSLHVIKGKTTLIAGKKSSKLSMEVTAGKAKAISGITQAVSDIKFRENIFVRNINSETKLIWKGQNELDLADMIGGGNGLGTGRINVWFDLAAGKEGTMLMDNPRQQLSREEISKLEKRVTDGRYHAVSGKSYIDGVFSPDGKRGEVQVSSQGHVWNDCPDTSGIYFEDIFNGSYINTSYNHRLILNGQVYGTKEFPAIALHSNAGITFDLQAIRRDMPGFEITRFKAICGVSEEAGKGANKEDFWVLVDGQKRFEAKELQSGSESRDISIPINSQDRFLTLVSTDGDLAPNYDWGFFGMPRLEIEDLP